MKRSLGVAFLTLMFSVSMFAAKNAQTVIFHGPIQVGTTQLPAGEYKATWTGTGAAAQLTLAAGKKNVTVPAQIVDGKSQTREIHTITKQGVEVLQELQFENLKLVVKDAPQSGN